jgi:hypothetical protein
MNSAHKALWQRFAKEWNIFSDSVQLFQSNDAGKVATKMVGSRSRRPILMRSNAMETMLIDATETLISDWTAGTHQYDGLIYVMHLRDENLGDVIPLYIGKTETFGKSENNLSVNLKNLQTDRSKFARWGDGYAYHIGDLSAVTLLGHDQKKKTKKYQSWADSLFHSTPTESPRLRKPVYFWTVPWKGDNVGIWKEYGPTRLSFLEYLLIGVASSVFTGTLLNREGQNR